MGRATPKRKKKSQDPRKREVERIATELRMPGLRRTNALYNLKTDQDVGRMLYFLSRSLKDREILTTFHGPAFPKTIRDLLSVAAYAGHGKVHSELMWGLFRVSLFAVELAEFVALREQFERAVLLDERTLANGILDTVQEKFGISLWLLNNRLTIAQVWSGLEEKRKLASEYLEEASQHSVKQLLIAFIAKRSEATGLKNYLQDELEKFFGDSSNSLLEAYFRTKLFDLGQIATPNIAATLLFEAQFSLIDHYEAIVLILQSVVVDDQLPDIVAQDIHKFLRSHAALTDRRLAAISRTLDEDYEIALSEIDPTRAQIIECYSSGLYDEVMVQTTTYLLAHPDDVAICALRAKASLRATIGAYAFPGLLGELDRLFGRLLEFGKDTYGAAFAIVTMHERFYGHSWAVMARAIMNDALEQETISYPQVGYRYILTMDRYISPFTALSMPAVARDRLRANELIAEHFPRTRDVLTALLEGARAQTGDQMRLTKYAARHDLITGNYATAAAKYSDLMTVGAPLERFRAAAGATLAYLAMDNLPKAVDAVVSGALLNKEVPIVLPIRDVVERLDAVETWPSSITLPILFELYTSHFTDDKATHLRFAFERFQLAYNIKEPEDLAVLAPRWGHELLVTYLDKVWRPDVMRQTLLYETPKETEDARIAVCRVLAALDPENSTKYQEEIRDRVKRQEIAKGTTLVEQTKVYVDINAIKKALNTRLGDTYTRYKNATQAYPSQQDRLMEELADLVSNKLSEREISLTNALSTLHVLDYKESELDLQFTALFSEVTNEFLKGDHGLNAYLSTRVRHGTLANNLRKPLADEHLVTALKEDETGYLPNSSWDVDLVVLSDVERDRVINALNNFTASFDRIIDHVKNDLIQIKIYHHMTSSTEKVDALFLYRSSNLERKFIQEYDKKISSIEQFIDRCIESLWEKTDFNLANVRTTLRDQVRGNFLACFDHLTDEISSISDPSAVSGILNAIARAKTNFQTKFHVVQSWFKRSEVYDRQDYSPDYAVQIALNMVQKTIPNGNHELVVDINSESAGAYMPGRSLDAMVDVFACLLDNAMLRSGLPTDRLRVSVELSLHNGHFSALISNNVETDMPSASDIEKIKRVRDSLQKSDSRARAQREGGSGLHKIWRAITSPIYKEPFFWFDFEDPHYFKVLIKYNLEYSDNENIADRG